MVFFHGGGGCLGSAEQNKTHCNRYAVEGNCTVINVDYRVAPEHKAPAGSCDSYAALKCIISDYESFKIDTKRVGMFGNGAGAWICATVGMMLAEKDEIHLVKFQI